MNENVRLGYACVNMTLTERPKKLGGRVTTSRTCRKATWQNNSDDPKDWNLHLIEVAEPQEPTQKSAQEWRYRFQRRSKSSLEGLKSI